MTEAEAVAQGLTPLPADQVMVQVREGDDHAALSRYARGGFRHFEAVRLVRWPSLDAGVDHAGAEMAEDVRSIGGVQGATIA